MKVEEIVEKAKEMEDYLVKMRRDLHMHPELSSEEKKTSSIVKRELKKLGYEVTETAKTGVIGVLKGGNGKCAALRADMDALPIQEENNVPYKSQNPGKMHACGHDAHTAMLLGAASILSKLKDLRGEVKLIFQPAEEVGSGAKQVMEEGHLDDVDAIFGMHVWPDLPSGKIGIGGGALFASADAFTVSIRGKGGHGAYPHQAIDPIVVASDLINGYQKIVSRRVSPLDPCVLSVCKISAGTAFNVIPERVEMKGTIRTYSMKVRDLVLREAKKITQGYANAMGCNGSFNLAMKNLPVTINDEELSRFTRRALSGLGGITEPIKSMGAEDFAFYAQKVPGLFIELGIRNKAKGVGLYSLHNPQFDLDEAVLWKGAAIHSILANEFLKEK